MRRHLAASPIFALILLVCPLTSALEIGLTRYTHGAKLHDKLTTGAIHHHPRTCHKDLVRGPLLGTQIQAPAHVYTGLNG